uniref:Uncharacterized protein n=1 Tax=Avena sativa TaxID=4498 RepID=A0ACD5YG29_AVESA
MGAQAMPSSGGAGAVSRQGSLCSLTLSDVEGQLHGVNLDDLLRTAAGSRRTADEVWRDIQGAATGCARPPPAAQMTLEDFLSRSGDVALATGAGSAPRWAVDQYNPPPPVPEQRRHDVGRPLPRPLGVGAGPVLDALYQDHDGTTMSGRKRAAASVGGPAPGPGEKTVERRKKRMIKNRESAARSRARKQAYTNELENKISLLEEENERLRNHKAFEPVVQHVPQQEPATNQLRRRNSASF